MSAAVRSAYTRNYIIQRTIVAHAQPSRPHTKHTLTSSVSPVFFFLLCTVNSFFFHFFIAKRIKMYAYIIALKISLLFIYTHADIHASRMSKRVDDKNGKKVINYTCTVSEWSMYISLALYCSSALAYHALAFRSVIYGCAFSCGSLICQGRVHGRRTSLQGAICLYVCLSLFLSFSVSVCVCALDSFPLAPQSIHSTPFHSQHTADRLAMLHTISTTLVGMRLLCRVPGLISSLTHSHFPISSSSI